jgi:hypothetical protein
MTTRVLMTTVLQKRRAQWTLPPKASPPTLGRPPAKDDDEPEAEADLSPKAGRKPGQSRTAVDLTAARR